MKNNSSYHTPVLLKEAIEALQIKKGYRYIDGTLGGGGHAEAILDRGGELLAIDKDEDAITEAKKRFHGRDKLKIVKGDFRNIKEIATENKFLDCSGILFDLGTSVHQLKDEKRGFSFVGHALIDMRMDKNKSLTAAEIINKWSKSSLVDIFQRYGEESEAEVIAERIVAERRKRKIIYTDDFSEIVSQVKKRKEPGIHPATKVFQAIRIAVNDELEAIKEGLRGCLEILGGNGRVVVISFHSLEDRIVKQSFLGFEKEGFGKIITKKPITSSFEELKMNKKSRSAKLRIFEKN